MHCDAVRALLLPPLCAPLPTLFFLPCCPHAQVDARCSGLTKWLGQGKSICPLCTVPIHECALSYALKETVELLHSEAVQARRSRLGLEASGHFHRKVAAAPAVWPMNWQPIIEMAGPMRVWRGALLLEGCSLIFVGIFAVVRFAHHDLVWWWHDEGEPHEPVGGEADGAVAPGTIAIERLSQDGVAIFQTAVLSVGTVVLAHAMLRVVAPVEGQGAGGQWAGGQWAGGQWGEAAPFGLIPDLAPLLRAWDWAWARVGAQEAWMPQQRVALAAGAAQGVMRGARAPLVVGALLWFGLFCFFFRWFAFDMRAHLENITEPTAQAQAVKELVSRMMASLPAALAKVFCVTFVAVFLSLITIRAAMYQLRRFRRRWRGPV